MTRDWTEDELRVINGMPRSSQIKRPKLTREQIHDIRRRVDSLTVPWTYKELARDYGMSEVQMARIARREAWKGAYFEPEGQWWKEAQENK